MINSIRTRLVATLATVAVLAGAATAAPMFQRKVNTCSSNASIASSGIGFPRLSNSNGFERERAR